MSDDNQLSLDHLPFPARQRGPATSWAAARDLDRQLVSERCRGYLLSIWRAGHLGRIRDEVSTDTDARGVEDRSLSRRITDLVHAGLVEDSGRTRTGESGRQQTVWVVTRYGRELAAKLSKAAS